MFEIGNYVFYGSEGVCRIDDIVSSPFSDAPDGVKYYVLHSAHGGGSTAYIPLDRAESLIRPLMSESDIALLMSKINGVILFEEINLKFLKEEYNVAIKSGNPLEWVRVIKTVEARTINGRENGKKVSDAERAYAENARRFLYKEMSIVLCIPEDKVEEYIADATSVL